MSQELTNGAAAGVNVGLLTEAEVDVPLSGGDDDDDIPVKRSKRERKMDKFGGPEGIAEYWKKKKLEKKQRDKEKRAGNKQKSNEHWANLSDEEKEALRIQALATHEKRRAEEAVHHAAKLDRLDFKNRSVPTLVFDTSFQGIMSPPDQKSTVQQLKISYSTMRKHHFNLRPLFLGYGVPDSGSSPSVLDPPAAAPVTNPPVHVSINATVVGALNEYDGFKAYPPYKSPLHWSEWVGSEEAKPLAEGEVSNKPMHDRLVYLSADSDTTLTDLDPSDIYIIGCFVDHNTKKGYTHKIAQQHNIRTAKLPLQETLVQLGNLCKVLTVNHVVEMLSVFQDTKSWVEACKVLPSRREEPKPGMKQSVALSQAGEKTKGKTGKLPNDGVVKIRDPTTGDNEEAAEKKSREE